MAGAFLSLSSYKKTDNIFDHKAIFYIIFWFMTEPLEPLILLSHRGGSRISWLGGQIYKGGWIC